MPMLAPVLKAGLLAMTETDKKSDGVKALKDAFKNYYSTMMAGPIPAASVDAGIATMEGPLNAMADNGFATAVQNAVMAFWGTVAPAAASVFPPAIAATPPPAMGTIAALLTPILAANTSGSLALPDCADAIANAIHGTQMGAMAIFPPPPAGIGPQPIM